MGFRHDAIAHVRLQYSVNTTFVCTGKPKHECTSPRRGTHLVAVVWNWTCSISELCLWKVGCLPIRNTLKVHSVPFVPVFFHSAVRIALSGSTTLFHFLAALSVSDCHKRDFVFTLESPWGTVFTCERLREGEQHLWSSMSLSAKWGLKHVCDKAALKSNDMMSYKCCEVKHKYHWHSVMSGSCYLLSFQKAIILQNSATSLRIKFSFSHVLGSSHEHMSHWKTLRCHRLQSPNSWSQILWMLSVSYFFFFLYSWFPLISENAIKAIFNVIWNLKTIEMWQLTWCQSEALKIIFPNSSPCPPPHSRDLVFMCLSSCIIENHNLNNAGILEFFQ